MLQMTSSLLFIETLVTALTISTKTVVTYVAGLQVQYRVHVQNA